jgi:hypothetical protein
MLVPVFGGAHSGYWTDPEHWFFLTDLTHRG